MEAIKQNTVAVIFDYDLTLSPYYMQDEVLFPHYGIDPINFWRKCNQLSKEDNWDSELAYLKCLLDYLQIDRLSNQTLQNLGRKLTFYPGVVDFLSSANKDILQPLHREHDIKIEFYIVSSGLKALLAGSELAPLMKAIYACEFSENTQGIIDFPKRVVTHTGKTQFLFRINKGLLDEQSNVNDYIPAHLRPIPFEHMIYIGDGSTDIPCFTLMNKYGGSSIAVYNQAAEQQKNSFQKCYQLSYKTQRVQHIAPADYRPQSHLRLLLEQTITDIANRMINKAKLQRNNSTIAAPGF